MESLSIDTDISKGVVNLYVETHQGLIETTIYLIPMVEDVTYIRDCQHERCFPNKAF